ncbi:MAG: hypothetical protein K2X39_10325 [Silvanigrellaceae bacterium]|nr:hypothetical protein [Silvanigrellaceae bacterium]
MQENFYKYWVNENACEPEEAASLILGFDPQIALRKNEYIREIFIKENSDIGHLAKVLRGYTKGIWSLNIFGYINLALANNYTISVALLTEIHKFVENLIHDHQMVFNKTYPYITRLLNLKETTAHEAIETLSAATKHIKWQEVAVQLLKQNPSYNKEQLINEVFNFIKENDPAFITKLDGSLVPVSSIERNLNFKDLKKSLLKR